MEHGSDANNEQREINRGGNHGNTHPDWKASRSSRRLRLGLHLYSSSPLLKAQKLITGAVKCTVIHRQTNDEPCWPIGTSLVVPLYCIALNSPISHAYFESPELRILILPSWVSNAVRLEAVMRLPDL